MAYVIADPQMMTAAARDLASVASNLDAAHMVAAAPTVAVIPAAADEVSAGIAHLFSQHAANYQALAGKAAAFNDQFVQNLTASGSSYASAEDAIASLLQALDSKVSYYTTAGLALTSMIVTFPIAMAYFAAIPIFWPFLLLGPILFLGNLATLFSEVSTGQPISYPITYLFP